jgi:NitT/TauT family transport system permease protein
MPLSKTWVDTLAELKSLRPRIGIDLLLLAGLAGALYGIIDLASNQWTAELRPTIEIDLDDFWALPRYTFFSLMRGLVAYVLSLAFTLVYGYWAAKDRQAERVLVPLLDILQSIPVLSFMPGLVLALVALFPSTNIGLELAAIIMIFTGQAWNMTFSYYHSLRSVPMDLREVSTVYRFSWWQRLKWVELPFATMGLVWNSMMSMAGGWFFLMINEAFRLGDKDFRLPGIGSYMSVAVDHNRWDAMILAILAMVAMIVLLDQLLWRPVVVWAQKFRFEEGGLVEAQSSWFLTLLRRSQALTVVRRGWHWSTAWWRPPIHRKAPARAETPMVGWVVDWVARVALVALLATMLYGAWHLVGLLREISPELWLTTVAAAGVTLTRVLVSTALGTLWAVPAGLAIGLSPRLARVLQPVVQVMASFPAPMLFPLVVFVLTWIGVTLDWGCIVLMLLGTQWYILFNVMAGAMAIPADLQEAARSYRIVGWRRFWSVHVPAIFPYLVTGWVTAAGGAWNASIVSEYVTFKGQQLEAWGLGAQISAATEQGNFALLAASTLVMSVMVVAFNRTVWRYCYRLAEERYSLNK